MRDGTNFTPVKGEVAPTEVGRSAAAKVGDAVGNGATEGHTIRAEIPSSLLN